MSIHTTMGLAVHSAQDKARLLSLTRPEPILAVVTRDTQGRAYLSWATVPQDLAANETQVGVWQHGERTHSPEGGEMIMRYRIVVGERGNEVGHIIHTDATTEAHARAALRQAIKPYGVDGWGRIECNATGDVTMWRRLEEVI